MHAHQGARVAKEIRQQEQPDVKRRQSGRRQDDESRERHSAPAIVGCGIRSLGEMTMPMIYRTTKMRYRGGGRIKYLVYRSSQPLRTGEKQERTRVHRMYFPENATNIKFEGPMKLIKRTGKWVYGVAVHYRYRLRGAMAHRDQTRYKIPSRWGERTKIVKLPPEAHHVRMTTKPPTGPKMAVA